MSAFLRVRPACGAKEARRDAQGRTGPGREPGQPAAGALASDLRVFTAVRQAGIVAAEQPMDLLDCRPLLCPPSRSKRVAGMTLGGGWGVVTADLCVRKRPVCPRPFLN